MGMTYFRRLRMEFDLSDTFPEPASVPPQYQLLPFSEQLIREHAAAKFHSFRCELDANVFPCLGRRDGCLRLMREISRRTTFVPEATWLLRYRESPGSPSQPVGTIQGLSLDRWGAVQNLGIEPTHRGHGLGTLLLARAAEGFRSTGLLRMHLEVTTDNTAAVRLYERLGFRRVRVVYKAAEVAGA